jgi:hypothetical protein
MAKEKQTGLRLMVKGDFENTPIGQWDYLWVTQEEIKENRNKGYILFSEVPD